MGGKTKRVQRKIVHASASEWMDSYPAFLAYAIHLTGDIFEAEDILADVFERCLVLRLKGQGPKENYRAYVRRAIYNRFVSILRVSQKLCVDHDQFEERFIGAGGVDQKVEAAEKFEWLVAQLHKHDPLAVSIFIRVYVDGERVRDVSRELGCSPNVLSARLFRLRKRLQQEMSPLMRWGE